MRYTYGACGSTCYQVTTGGWATQQECENAKAMACPTTEVCQSIGCTCTTYNNTWQCPPGDPMNPLHALATVQMNQWNETDVPEKLKKKPISTKLGKGRNWIPKPGQELSMQFYLERLHKENLGFHLDDNMQVRQMDVDQFVLVDR
jgi:hypothetical protein